MKSNVNYDGENNRIKPSNISGINHLEPPEKREIYARMIPHELLDHFGLSSSLFDEQGNDLLVLNAPSGSTVAEMSLYHKVSAPDPVFYGQMVDTMNQQFHILFYILNDPDSPRFDIDRLPDGTLTQFGTLHRNQEAELAAIQYGLAPGQVHQGLRMLGEAIQSFEGFVSSLGQEMYFAEPLFYHNAVLFERYGFAYEKGRRLMELIQAGFQTGEALLETLDGSTPFRQPEAAHSIRLRSWAIHDGILGEPFTNVTMYKRVGKSANLSTCSECTW